jgi:hypothetical protein
LNIRSDENALDAPTAMKRLLLSFAAMAIFLPQALSANELSSAETKQIEALIATVGQMADAAFIRNGRAYDSATAAEFLRRKWRQQAAEIRSVEDFIEKVASFSSTTGRPYMIRFNDGREIPCSAVLRAELSKLRNNQP